jgi:hypothetical protein
VNGPDVDDSGQVDMDAIAEALGRLGVPAVIEQTGGGTATLYAGRPSRDTDGELVYPIGAGPGVFLRHNDRGPGGPAYHVQAVAWRGEFNYGWNTPDGDGDMWYPPDGEGEAQIAGRIAELLTSTGG